MVIRQPESYVQSFGVSVPARVCAYLLKYGGLEDARHRITDPESKAVLQAFHAAANTWRGSARGTEVAAPAELAPPLNQWLTTGQVASKCGVGDRAVRKAISQGHLKATQVDGRYQIAREDFELWKSSRKK